MKKSIITAFISLSLIGACIPAAHAQEDILVVETMRPTLYMNGGIGADEQSYMKNAAKDFNLRMTFSERKDGEYITDVKLSIVDIRGNTVLYLSSAGPLTNVMLPAGKYRVAAAYKGMLESQTVTLDGKQGKDLSFHWQAATKR